MKLFETVHSMRTLFRERERRFMAMTENEHGHVVAFGESHQAALDELRRTVIDLRTPRPEELQEPFGPRTDIEWLAERSEFLA